MTRFHKKQLLLCALLLILNLSFIWGNSLMSGPQSSELSGGVMEWLKEMMGGSIPGGEHLIRKLAHFSEFACLGLLLTWLFQLLHQRGIYGFAMPLLCGSLAALTDETIQVLTPERGPSVIDVWIDTAGVITGTLILLLIFRLYRKRKQLKSNGGN